MILRKQHRLLGSILVLPFIAWSLTGIFFLVRPAYEQAYAVLSPKTYPAEEVRISAEPQWQEMRILNSVLGQHLLVKENGSWRQVDPTTGAERPSPSVADLERFVEDAISQNPRRYGELLRGESNPFRTSEGVLISLDWGSLSLNQQGGDTRWIDRIYNVHYLRWTGIALFDSIMGVLGLLLLLMMTVSGLGMLLRRSD